MLCKQSAIAVTVVAMLVAAPFLGGFATVPAFATHDPDARQVTIKQFTKNDDESTNIDAIEFTAKKSVLRASGTIVIVVLQDGGILHSATLSASKLTTTYTTLEIEMDIEVQGSFEILVEYLGSGSVQGNNINILAGTETGAIPPEDTEGTDGSSDPNEPEPNELKNIVTTKVIAVGDDETLELETVEFAVKKSVLRAGGTITVAIVQDDNILATDSMTTSGLSTTYLGREAGFDLEVTGEFQVVVMYEGSGSVSIKDLNVLGLTSPAEEVPQEENPEEVPAEEPPVGDLPSQNGTFVLTVNAIDQNNQPVTGMWVALLQGMDLVDNGETEATFTLQADQDYIVEMGDFFDETNAINYEFDGWADSTSGSRRPAADLVANEEFTAKYIVTTGAAPPAPDNDEAPTINPQPSSGPGTITAFAHRIPSEHWGSTFVGANAQMYFVLYNSTGSIVHTGFFDENGHDISGLNEGEQYWIYPTDCEECHDDPHDVVFRHWEDNATERPRPVTAGMSVGAYYEFIPPS